MKHSMRSRHAGRRSASFNGCPCWLCRRPIVRTQWVTTPNGHVCCARASCVRQIHKAISATEAVEQGDMTK